MVDAPFFPSSSSPQLEQIVIEPQAVAFVLPTVAATATCPECEQASDRVYSRYRRRLTDLPAQGRAIRVELLARRFFCTAAGCQRRIFAERLPDVVAAHGWTTARLSDAHCEGLQLNESDVHRVFEPGTSLTVQVQALYKLWDKESPPLAYALTAALATTSASASWNSYA